MPIAGKTSSRRDSPGWGGSYIGMGFSFLVVVQIIDKFHVGTNEAEHKTPVA
ncbi:hypothetical protein PAGU2196_06030 [Pseudomonas sp. PAGU 2196]|nr:hypothetical protein PAGU2196_06030 [Pseudomonas sp. PAGU 2196]